MGFYKCNETHEITEFKGTKATINKGDIVVEGGFWWYRTVVLPTPTKPLRILHKHNYRRYYDKYYTIIHPDDIKYLIPHLPLKVHHTYVCSLNNKLNLLIGKYRCVYCANKVNGTNIIPEKENTVGTCKGCGNTKVKLYNKQKFRLDIFNHKLK